MANYSKPELPSPPLTPRRGVSLLSRPTSPSPSVPTLRVKASLLSLPDELLLKVAHSLAYYTTPREYISYLHLLSLLRVSHRVHDACLPALYHDVALHSTTDEMLFLRSILANPTWTRYIKVLVLRTGDSLSELGMLITALPLDNLKSFTLFNSQGDCIPYQFTTFLTKMHHLESLRIDASFDHLHFEGDDTTLSLGEQFPHLKELALGEFPEYDVTTVLAHDKLKTLCIKIEEGEEDDDEDDATFPEHRMELLTSSLTSLEVLEIECVGEPPDVLAHGLANGLRDYQKSLCTHHSFAPHLRHLILNGVVLYPDEDNRPVDGLVALLVQLSHAPQLEKISFMEYNVFCSLNELADWTATWEHVEMKTVKEIVLSYSALHDPAPDDNQLQDDAAAQPAIYNLISHFPSLTHLTLRKFLTHTESHTLPFLTTREIQTRHPVLHAFVALMSTTPLLSLRIDTLVYWRESEKDRQWKRTARWEMHDLPPCYQPEVWLDLDELSTECRLLSLVGLDD